jgi:hypothetical protein
MSFGYFPDTEFEFDSVYDMMDAVSKMVEFHVQNKMSTCSPSELGLDDRSAAVLYVDESYIAVRASAAGSLDYYGGFEYVDRDCIEIVGGYKFYSAEDSRVQDHIDTYFGELVTSEEQ